MTILRVTRRAFLAGLGGAAVRPIVARAQQPERVRRIGELMFAAENDPEGKSRVQTIRQGFRELGWIEGGNIQIDYRWTGGIRPGQRPMLQNLLDPRLM
jgi:putative tryptophan/tyrosine transport system substrate-binding protein